MMPRVSKSVFLPLLALVVCLSVCRSGQAQESIEQTTEKVVKLYAADLELALRAIDNSKRQNAPAPTTTPGIGTNLPARTPEDLSAGGKLKYGLKSAFLSPGSYFYSAVYTGIQQISEREPDFKGTDDKAVDGFSRFG